MAMFANTVLWLSRSDSSRFITQQTAPLVSVKHRAITSEAGAKS